MATSLYDILYRPSLDTRRQSYRAPGFRGVGDVAAPPAVVPPAEVRAVPAIRAADAPAIDYLHGINPAAFGESGGQRGSEAALLQGAPGRVFGESGYNPFQSGIYGLGGTALSAATGVPMLGFIGNLMDQYNAERAALQNYGAEAQAREQTRADVAAGNLPDGGYAAPGFSGPVAPPSVAPPAPLTGPPAPIGDISFYTNAFGGLPTQPTNQSAPSAPAARSLAGGSGSEYTDDDDPNNDRFGGTVYDAGFAFTDPNTVSRDAQQIAADQALADALANAGLGDGLTNAGTSTGTSRDSPSLGDISTGPGALGDAIGPGASTGTSTNDGASGAGGGDVSGGEPPGGGQTGPGTVGEAAPSGPSGDAPGSTGAESHSSGASGETQAAGGYSDGGYGGGYGGYSGEGSGSNSGGYGNDAGSLGYYHGGLVVPGRGVPGVNPPGPDDQLAGLDYGEHITPAAQVAALGRGSPQRGSQVIQSQVQGLLDAMRRRQSGKSSAPKARPPIKKPVPPHRRAHGQRPNPLARIGTR